MPGLGRPDGDYPRVGRHISRRTYARSLSPSDLRRTLQIYALMQSGLSQAAIARQLGVHRSTVKRELDRNTGARSYRFKQAQEEGVAKRKTAFVCARKMKPDLVKLIEEKLTQEAVEPRSDQRLADEKRRRLDQPRAHLPHVWEDKKKRRNPLCPAASPR